MPCRASQQTAFNYRDGLLIALLALIPLRRRTLAALRIGQQLVKSDGLWGFDIPAQDVKTRRPLDYPISPGLSRRIDLYLAKFRRRIRGQLGTMGFGRPIKVVLWTAGRSTTPFAVAPARPLAFRSICITFDPPQGPFGQSKTLRTCEVSKTYLATHRSIRQKSITSWRSRASRVVLLLVLSIAFENEQQL
jgi:hypothetical protein